MSDKLQFVVGNKSAVAASRAGTWYRTDPGVPLHGLTEIQLMMSLIRVS